MGSVSQKILETAVAVGVATYALQETLDDPTVKKFFAVIRKVADNELDDKLKSLSAE